VLQRDAAKCRVRRQSGTPIRTPEPRRSADAAIAIWSYMGGGALRRTRIGDPLLTMRSGTVAVGCHRLPLVAPAWLQRCSMAAPALAAGGRRFRRLTRVQLPTPENRINAPTA
jgi:hypothetical protein